MFSGTTPSNLPPDGVVARHPYEPRLTVGNRQLHRSEQVAADVRTRLDDPRSPGKNACVTEWNEIHGFETISGYIELRRRVDAAVFDRIIVPIQSGGLTPTSDSTSSGTRICQGNAGV